ncbi:NitT/TauT family transport system substrate-binding protein [Paramixta manurensis]|uniref:NitT/TauT family transport system substrate-binding protein n=1 Tax=Paramixta manurensis TaxID=2740817 RepID=A0A6M8U824_9GAMM|nr:NitT/TauT family transport system substrate-binding protein [Erwiniaceae bacterium PD-1]
MQTTAMRGRGIVAVLLLGLSAFSLQAKTTLTLGAAQNSLGSLPLVIAQQKGFFADEGLQVDTVSFKGGAPAVQALAGGSVAACICAADHAVRLQNRHLGGRVLVALTEHHGYGLVALANNPAAQLSDLRGKNVGITSPGSLTDNTLRYYISEKGLNAERDFRLVGIGTGGPMRAAIESGAVQAGMLTTPDVQAALADPRFKLIQDFRTLQYPALDLVVVDRWLNAHRDEAQRLTRAVIKAEQVIQTDPVAVQAGVDKMYPRLSPALRKVLAEEAPKLLSHDGKMAPQGYQLMVKMLKVADPTLSAPDYSAITVPDLLSKG